MEVHPGEFVLVTGGTGAGKTTLLRLIYLDLKPDSGEIVLDDLAHHQARGKRLALWRRKLGLVSAEHPILPDRTVLDNLRIAAECCPKGSLSARARALRALALVGMAHKLHSMPEWLSSGERQRVMLARALVNEPEVVLADEPITSLDGPQAAEIVELLARLNLAGTAVLLATHQPERFRACRPREIRLSEGRVV